MRREADTLEFALEKLESRQMLAGNAFSIIYSQELFEANTDATAQPALQDIGRVTPQEQPFAFGDLSFSHEHGEDIWVGSPNGDWTELTEGADLALNGIETLNVDFQTPIRSFGMNVVDEGARSTFEIRLFSNGTQVAPSTTYRSVPNEVSFMGIVSNVEFDRIEVHETGDDGANEYFSGFMTGTKLHRDLGTDNSVKLRGSDITIRGTNGNDDVEAIGNTIRKYGDGNIEWKVTHDMSEIRNFNVNLRGGDDTFQQDEIRVTGRNIVNTGSGLDQVVIDAVDNRVGTTTVRTGADADYVAIDGASFGTLNVITGAGNDELVFGNPIDASRRINVRFGSGDDFLAEVPESPFTYDFIVHGGSGFDATQVGELPGIQFISIEEFDD